MSEIILSANKISKSFFGIPVLKNIDLDIYKGEVHAILGENGAGKSTLIKILSGVYNLDSGTITYLGKDVVFHKPVDAINSGIITIHQELNMCTHLTVLDNLFLGREIKDKFGKLNTSKMAKEAYTCLKQFGLENEIHTQVKKLPISKQQIVEIARAISWSSKVIIMDEPNSSLSEKESLELFKVVKDLKKMGIAIIYITHRLEELEKIIDRVTVLRDGNFIMSDMFDNTTIDDIVKAMAGRSISEKYPYVMCHIGENLLEVSNMTCEPFFRNINFTLREGEILGLAGLVGAGRTKIAKSLAGIYPMEMGDVSIKGKKVHLSNIKKSIDSGIAYISEDRKQEGLAVKMTVSENVALPNMDIYTSSTKTILYKSIVTDTMLLVDKLKIKMRSAFDSIQFLSGGNQQKFMIGKWMLKKPHIFIFDEPTRGVDVNAKINIYNTINDFKQNKVGVLIISSELPELLGICDRILVVANGNIMAELEAKNTSQEEILKYAAH